MRRKLLNIMLLGACLASCGRQADSGVDYDLEPMPPVHSPLPENSVPMGDAALEIVYPDSAKLNTAVGFRIVCE